MLRLIRVLTGCFANPSFVLLRLCSSFTPIGSFLISPHESTFRSFSSLVSEALSLNLSVSSIVSTK